MEDENELYGLESDYVPEEEYTEDEESVSGLSAVSAPSGLRAELVQRLLDREKKASEVEQQDFNTVLNTIEQAKQRLLAQPSKGEELRNIAMRLTQPRKESDPRFFERRNLYTFLRDIGEYGGEQAEARKEAEAKALELDQLTAKYRMDRAQKEGSQARQLLAQYLSKEPAAKTERQSEFERLIAGLPEDEQKRMRRDRARVMSTRAPRAEKDEKTGPGGEAAQILWATETLDSKTSTPAQRKAAQKVLETKEPRDIRVGRVAKEKYADSYLGRVKDQNQFTIPDIQTAIDQIDEGGVFVAGNIAKIIRGVPVIGQAATDLEKTMESIQAKVGFDKMLQLKESSPTGSTGLGAVSNAEQRLLQAVKGSLDKDQSPKNLRKNLVRLKDFYEKEVFDILDRETGIKGLTGIDETLSMIGQGAAESEPPAASAAPMIDPDALRRERERREKAKREAGGR